jgi:hypothetical protein
MTDLDPRCVLAVPEPQTAELIAAWLTSKGILAELVSSPPRAVTEPITHTQLMLPGEFQVWVAEPNRAAEARELIEEHQAGVAALREREARRANRTGTTAADCEGCGKASEWSASLMGTTQNCPHCDSYMDVPDPDDNFDEWGYSDDPGNAQEP